MWRVVLNTPASRDLAAAHRWYEGERAGLGREFLDEIDRLVELLARAPQSIRIHDPASSARRVLAHRFPYHVYYFVEGSTVRVFAIVHAARSEETWTERL